MLIWEMMLNKEGADVKEVIKDIIGQHLPAVGGYGGKQPTEHIHDYFINNEEFVDYYLLQYCLSQLKPLMK